MDIQKIPKVRNCNESGPIAAVLILEMSGYAMMSHEFLQLELRAGEGNGMNFRGSESKLWTPATCLHSHPAWGKRPSL